MGIPEKAEIMNTRIAGWAFACGVLLLAVCAHLPAQKAAWRQATEKELASVLPSRAQVENEHVETEMRTASGIVNGRGRYIAGVVLLTAGYSVEGKYSHYLVVQMPVRIGGVLHVVAVAQAEVVAGRALQGDLPGLGVHLGHGATVVGPIE